MYFQLIYTIIIVLLSIGGIAIMQLIKLSSIKIRVKKDRYKQLREFLTNRTDEKAVDKLLTNAGLPIDTFQFQLIRYFVFITWFVLSFITYKLHKTSFPSFQLLIALAIFYVTSPKLDMFKYDTPFKSLMLAIANRRKYKRNLELFRLISQLKNIAVTFGDNPPSSHFILEQLSKYSMSLRPIMNTFIKEWSIGNKDVACEYFCNAVGTQEALDFSNLMRKLDEMKPNDMKYQLQILQDGIFSSMGAKRNSINELRSLLIYSISVMVFVCVMYNFIIVGFSIESFILNNYQ